MATGIAHSTAAADRPEHRSVNGKFILLALVLTACVVPLITWGVLRAVERAMAIDQPPLVWAERASWSSPPIKVATLEDRPSNYSMRQPTSKWKSLDFAVAPEVEAAVHAGAAIAWAADRDPAAWAADENVGSELAAAAAAQPDFFYPHYLLGSWHRLRGEADAADEHFTRAFALAPAVIKIRYIDPNDQPMVGLEVGTIEITCDRVFAVPTDPDDPDSPRVNELDQTLKLVYPALETDTMGAVYLPIFHTVYRATNLPQPPGYRAQYRWDGWFQFPGRIGAPRPTVVVPAR
jgi:hypothetical protein